MNPIGHTGWARSHRRRLILKKVKKQRKFDVLYRLGFFKDNSTVTSGPPYIHAQLYMYMHNSILSKRAVDPVQHVEIRKEKGASCC